jgi:hypothetical protein
MIDLEVNLNLAFIYEIHILLNKFLYKLMWPFYINLYLLYLYHYIFSRLRYKTSRPFWGTRLPLCEKLFQATIYPCITWNQNAQLYPFLVGLFITGVKTHSLLSAADVFSKCLRVEKLQGNEFCSSNIVTYVGAYQLFRQTERIFLDIG